MSKKPENKQKNSVKSKIEPVSIAVLVVAAILFFVLYSAARKGLTEKTQGEEYVEYEKGTVVVTGSLYFVSEVRSLYKGESA